MTLNVHDQLQYCTYPVLPALAAMLFTGARPDTHLFQGM